MSEDPPRRMPDEEIVVLAKDAIDAFREETRRSADNDGAAKELQQQPGVTIDLGHKHITSLPDEVVEIIKDEIERLALSHNALSTLPSRLSECRRLRYLNIRYNALREFPLPVLQLSSLEILDVSKNRIKTLPAEISNLTSLKVLAIQRNKIERLPLCLGEINSLQVLKLDGNPILFPPPDICSIKKDAPSPSNENEKDAVITTQIKRYLRQIATRERLKIESEGESSEGNVETPRPPKRTVSGRFPVKPSISSIEAFELSRPDSPGGPPPIPTRSHFRGQSQQSNNIRRPLISPLILSNERNRSQSEGAQSATVRTKRGGLVMNNVSGLGSVDERSNNTAHHSRGYSQGSTLSGSTLGNGGSAASSFSSDASGQRPVANRPLSDLLEHKRRSRAPDVVVEASKTVLYALAQLHDPILHILRVTRCYEEDDKRRGHAFAQRVRDSNFILRQLAEYLRKFDTLAEEDEEDADNLSVQIRSTVHRCVQQYMFVIHSLCDNCQEILRDCDPRYLRTLMVLQQASLAEIRNACAVLGVDFLSDGRPPMEQENNPRLMASSANPSYTNLRRAPAARRFIGNGSKTSLSNEYGLESSRVNTMISLNTATPRSGESFSTIASRPSQYTAMEDIEEMQFEKIFLKLRSATATTQDNLIPCRQHFVKVKQGAEMEFDPSDSRLRLLANIVQKTEVVLDVTRRLSLRLSAIKLRDPYARNQQEFWSHCHTYAKVWTDLVQSVPEVARLGAVSEEHRKAMRTIHKAVKEVTLVINSSPWSHLAVPTTNSTPIGTVNSSMSMQSSIQSPQPNTAIPPQSSISSLSSMSSMSSMPPPQLPYGRTYGLSSSGSSTNLAAAAGQPGSLQPINTLVTYGLRNGSDSALPSASSTISSSTMGYATPVPPTPLSAALGAAAQATVPSTPAAGPQNGVGLTPVPGGLGIGGTMAAGGGGISTSTVFERADQLLRNQQRRV